jgi:hypothetical protein
VLQRTSVSAVDDPLPVPLAGQHQYLLCRVAVGRAYALLDSSSARVIPEGYDSLYVHKEEDELESDGLAAYGQDYIVMNTAQVLPEYVVHFDFDPADAVYGPPPTASMSLEERRDHFRSKVNEVRAEVSRALSVLGPALGNRTEEMLSDLTSKYESALHASTQPEPLLEERKRSINEGIRRISSKLEQVKTNSDAVYTEVCKRMQTVLEHLEDLTRRKTAVLLSEELELRRQLKQMQSSEALIPHLQDALQPTAFVEAWESHQAMRREMISQMSGSTSAATAEALESVKADLRVVGDLDVVASMESEAGYHRGGTSAVPSVAAAAGAGTSSAIATRLFEGSGSVVQQPSASAGLGSSQVDATWRSFLRQENGVSDKPSAGSALAMLDSIVPSGEGSVSDAEINRARAALDMERAKLSSVRAKAAVLPPAQHSIGEAAVAEQEARVSSASRALDAAVSKQSRSTARTSPEATPAAHRPGAVPPPVTVAADRAAPAESTVEPTPSRQHQQAKSPARDPKLHLDRVISRHRLSDEAARRLRRSGLDDASLSQLSFPGSELLQGDDAVCVYACLPFVRPLAMDPMTGEMIPDPAAQPTPPTCSLLFSTAVDSPPTFATLISALARAPGPTVIVVRANGHTFGGYAPDMWRFDSKFHGHTSAFLFSVTRDVRVPYVGRLNGPPQDTDAEERAAHERDFQQRQDTWRMAMMSLRGEAEANGVVFNDQAEVIANPNGFDLTPFSYQPPRHRPWKRVDAQRSDESELRFGLTDLVIDGDFARCSSLIESTFGIGLRPNSEDSKTFLAGAEHFAIEELEAWSVGVPAATADADPAAAATASGGW